MLWPLILPTMITVALVANLIVAIGFLSPKSRRFKRLVISLIAGCVLFVPACSGIMAVVDAVRFGTFEYQSGAEINDSRVSAYLPHSAQNVEVVKARGNFNARYQISSRDLHSFLDQQWALYGRYSVIERGQLTIGSGSTSFDALQWPRLDDASGYHGPIAANGAGFTIMYSASTGTAYQHMGYW